ncbi:hypothetical protein PF005_g27140 [Phytophthora fragariae]|uniref:pyruvate kinase n=1 Tax=Phytophthora fragariae TaxID=53985 RepID=A0A6A3DZI3_9STRA|nr:hypothetical protein PF009_g26755 [Phytophthora fragariae]KAE8973044.1 hypothetical protein PF011_g25404 [Phytophthora fragariae]KAE9076880.1 hypothetical protein PF007_g24458 [Phytophthora fragariae]KAE9087731.1 hypothetical protein PF006_g25735 [Phytophthora fragariae]KAE9171440.1 hypothetical protein PF005_g27140 [Phytophthora fragariae]
MRQSVNTEDMNLPGCKVLLLTLTEKNKDDLVNFGLIIPKFESPEILAKTDGVMVALDDHGSSPECTDGANAVLAGTKAVMLTRESANGDYPTQAVEVMFATCLQAETAIHYNDV